MNQLWTVQPDELGAVDAFVVRCIAGEIDRLSLIRATRIAGVDGLHRMQDLVARHARISLEQLRTLPRSERRQVANDIVIAESDAGLTMPGELAPLRTCYRS